MGERQNKKKSGLYRFAKKTVDIFSDFFNKASKAHIAAYSAQASFFVLISCVPFAMLAVSVLRLFITIEQPQMTAFVMDVFPIGLQEFALHIVNELYEHVSFSVVSITAIVLLWSAAKGMRSLVQGLQNVYGYTPRFDFIYNIVFSLICTLAFIVVITVTVLVLVFGRQLNVIIFSELPIVRDIIDSFLVFRNLLFLIPLTLLFALAYKTLAKNKIPFSKHFVGALFSSAGWMLFSYFYSIYIDHFANYSYIYGSLTAVILLMLWLYACMMIFLYGAMINVWYYEKGYSIKGMIRAVKNKRIHKNKQRDKDQ